ncbi:MAG: LytR/AlgR family response regulator transcription factor [Coprobacillaceae bacterium]
MESMEDGRIVLFEDDKEYRELLTKKLEEIFNEEILAFKDYDEKKLENIKIDLAVIDVDLSVKYTGIDVAKELNKRVEKPMFFYCSERERYMKKAFSTQPIDFVRKSHLDEDLKDAIAIINRMGFRAKTNIMLSNTIINIRKVMYIKSLDHYLKIYFEDRSMKTINSNIKNVLSVIEEYDFKQCHKSIVVNLHYIKGITTKAITLHNDETINMGRKYGKELFDYYRRWHSYNVTVDY